MRRINRRYEESSVIGDIFNHAGPEHWRRFNFVDSHSKAMKFMFKNGDRIVRHNKFDPRVEYPVVCFKRLSSIVGDIPYWEHICLNKFKLQNNKCLPSFSQFFVLSNFYNPEVMFFRGKDKYRDMYEIKSTKGLIQTVYELERNIKGLRHSPSAIRRYENKIINYTNEDGFISDIRVLSKLANDNSNNLYLE